MIQGRNFTFLNKKKSKLVLARPHCHPQDRENCDDNCNLIAIKPLAVTRKDSLDLFRIRPTSNSKNEQQKSKFKKTQSLPVSNKKITYSQQKSRALPRTKEVSNEVDEGRLESVLSLQQMVNQLLSLREQQQMEVKVNGNQKLLFTCILQLFKFIIRHHYQMDNKLFDKIQRAFSFLQERIHKQTQSKHKDNPKHNPNLTINREVFIVHNYFPNTKLEDTLQCSSNLEMSTSIQNEKDRHKDAPLSTANEEEFQNNKHFSHKIHQNSKDKVTQFNLHKRIRSKIEESKGGNQLVATSELDLFKKQHLELMRTYINNQPNKIVQSASLFHQQIEEEMFNYAEFLRVSRFGTSTYITDVNINALDALIAKDLKQTNKRIIQSEEQVLVKCRAMRDFVTRVREKYDSLIKQLMSVIDKKTELCRQFVSKVNKWYENYQARSQYLANLKEQYCEQLFRLYSQLKKMDEQMVERKRQQTLTLINRMKDRIDTIDRIVLIGNNFY